MSEMRRAGVAIARPPTRCSRGSLWLVVPASAEERHKSIMACAVRHVGFAALMDIAADEQGDLEPQQRGFVIPVFTAFPRPLQGDDGGGPAMSMGEHMGQ